MPCAGGTHLSIGVNDKGKGDVASGAEPGSEESTSNAWVYPVHPLEVIR